MVSHHAGTLPRVIGCEVGDFIRENATRADVANLQQAKIL
jgi:hypothetical protein